MVRIESDKISSTKPTEKNFRNKEVKQESAIQKIETGTDGKTPIENTAVSAEHKIGHLHRNAQQDTEAALRAVKTVITEKYARPDK